MAKTLGIPKENVRLISPYIGGGFGGKLFIRADALLAALGARVARRPVKVALTRPLMFNNTVHRPATIQRIRIGATQDGKIAAIGHESWSGDLPGGKPDSAVRSTRLIYAGAHRMTKTRLAGLDLPEAMPCGHRAMRRGRWPWRSPLMKWRKSFASTRLNSGSSMTRRSILRTPIMTFTQRHFVECLRTGADRFGWSKRIAEPGKARDGRWLVGLGVAAAYRDNPVMKSAARVRLDNRGMVIGRNRHDGYRHRQLYDHRPDGRGDDGRAARQGDGPTGRLRPFRCQRAPAGNGVRTAPPPASMPPA